jgi:hypothetical protein
MLCAGLSVSVPAFSQQPPACGSSAYAVLSAREKETTDNGETLFIPVIFHVVYNSEEQNIPDSRIYSQLEVLNEDFSRKNSDTTNTLAVFKGVAGDPNIQFYLADDIEPITRTLTSHGPFFNDDLHMSVEGGMDAYETSRYLNIWVADIAALLGYAASPGTAEFKDGVAINYKYLGRTEDADTPYNHGRTLTHETGHWLGLQHLWGNGDCDVNDGLADTPPQNDAVGGCSLDHSSCGNLNMTQNFMNLADDACMNLFTRDQSALMRQTLLTQRAETFSTDKLITGIENTTGRNHIDIYPNPITNGELSILIKDNNVRSLQVSIIDMTGKVISKRNIIGENRTITIGLAGHPEGLYVCTVQTSDRIYNKKIYLNNK